AVRTAVRAISSAAMAGQPCQSSASKMRMLSPFRFHCQAWKPQWNLLMRPRPSSNLRPRWGQTLWKARMALSPSRTRMMDWSVMSYTGAARGGDVPLPAGHLPYTEPQFALFQRGEFSRDIALLWGETFSHIDQPVRSITTPRH